MLLFLYLSMKVVVLHLLISLPTGIAPQPPKEEQIPPSKLSWTTRLVNNLWEMNLTPQNVIRLLGPKGPDVVKSILHRRFQARWNEEELGLVSDYFYHITAAPGSGEYALNALLQPVFVKTEQDAAAAATTANATSNANGNGNTGGAEKSHASSTNSRQSSERRSASRTGVYAREPLEGALCHLKVPLLMLYGDHDWLSYPTAEESVQLWRRHGVSSEYSVISNAGHHLYNDNVKEFNNKIIDWSTKHVYRAGSAGALRAQQYPKVK